MLRRCWPALPGLFQCADQDSVDSEAACAEHLSVHRSKVATNSTTTQQQPSQPRHALQRKDQWEKAAAEFYTNTEKTDTKERNAAGIERESGASVIVSEQQQIQQQQD